MAVSHHSTIVASLKAATSRTTALLQRIISRWKRANEYIERVLALWQSPEVFITNKRRRDGRITHVRCWYQEGEQLFSRGFSVDKIIGIWLFGQHRIYTAGLKKEKGKWVLLKAHKAQVKVWGKGAPYLRSEPDNDRKRVYNNLENLMDFNPANHHEIAPTHPRPWLDT